MTVAGPGSVLTPKAPTKTRREPLASPGATIEDPVRVARLSGVSSGQIGVIPSKIGEITPRIRVPSPRPCVDNTD